MKGQSKGSCPEMPKATKCDQCRIRLGAEERKKLARNTIAYFVIELIMSIGALKSKLTWGDLSLEYENDVLTVNCHLV